MYPICGRCRQRDLVCSGLSEGDGFLFFNENDRARRNSQRARGECGQRAIQLPIVSGQVLQIRPLVTSPQHEHPWFKRTALNDIPGPLKRDLETRAVDRFFVNWTLYPRNDGMSLGYMYDLPTLYNSAPSESTLWHAIRAIAFADIKYERDKDVTFSYKARKSYGAALKSIRQIATDDQILLSDTILAALLLIDEFEILYLARTELLGPHRDAIRHIMHARGFEQLLGRSSFALWRVALSRLQFRQVLLREAPDTEQIAWVDKLNTDHPDVRITADVLHMSILSAKARSLIQTTDPGSTSSQKVEEAESLQREYQNLITAMNAWTLETTETWKPKESSPQLIEHARDMNHPPSIRVPYFPFPRMLSYHDIWIAYMWNCHAACQLFFREALVNLINYKATLQGEALDQDEEGRIQAQRDAINELSGTIIRSFPPLLGYEAGVQSFAQGKMVGRFFSLFSMWIVQRAQFTSPQHKQTAFEVTNWINSQHRLE